MWSICSTPKGWRRWTLGGRAAVPAGSIRAARPGGYRLFVVLDNLSANKTPAIRRWAERANLELCFTPTNTSWANPIRSSGRPAPSSSAARTTPSHTVLARRMQDYLRWRNANARHPDVLAAQRRERARIRSQRQQRWGRPKIKAA
jgi:transposase